MNNQDKEEWEVEFDKMTEMPERLDLPWNAEHKETEGTLYGSQWYQESPYELSADKIKTFIKQTLSKREAEIREKIEVMKRKIGHCSEIIENRDDWCKSCELVMSNCDVSDVNQAYNQGLEDILSLLQPEGNK